MNLLATYVLPHPPIIVPEIGQGEEKKTEKTLKAYREIAHEINLLKPDTIIISTPHNVMYQDYFHISPGHAAQGTFSQFGHPELSFHVTYDQDLREAIMKKANVEHLSIGTLGEKDARLDHGVMVPLSFLEGNQKIIRLSLSGEDFLTHYQYGKAIQEAINESNKKVVFIASGDMSHVLKEDGPYGYEKEGPIFDEKVKDILSRGAFDELLEIKESFANKAKECGLRSFLIMAGVLDGLHIESELLSYEGPFGVGYAVAKYQVLGLDETNKYDEIYQIKETKKLQARKIKEDPFVALARTSLEHYLTYHKYIDPPKDLPKELYYEQKAVFVTLKKYGRLRGCIGTLQPTKQSVAEEIIHNAVSAGLKDPRFPEVRIDELSELTYSVDVLSLPEDVRSTDELDPLQYGIIVLASGKSGLLLPNLEGIDTIEKQIHIAKQKANIHEDEDYVMKRFKVTRHY